MFQDLYEHYQKKEQSKERERRWEERLNAWADSDASVFFSTLRDQINQFNRRPIAEPYLSLSLTAESSAKSGSVAFGDSRFDYAYQNRVLSVNFIGTTIAKLAYAFDVEIYEGTLEHFKDLMTGTRTFNRSGVLHSTGWRQENVHTPQLLRSQQLALECLERLIDNRLI